VVVTAGSAHARRTERTRQALIDTALQLFAVRGYEATTTDEIAEMAGVSPRTFFRYFRTKESVLFFGEDDFALLVAAELERVPISVNDVDALERCLVSLAARITALRRRVKLYQKAVSSSALLRGRERDSDEANARVVAAALARRRHKTRPDRAMELIAALSFLLMRRATEAWLRGPIRSDLGAAISAEFALLPVAIQH
jgi:AcrR family transcriptional regulator